MRRLKQLLHLIGGGAEKLGRTAKGAIGQRDDIHVADLMPIIPGLSVTDPQLGALRLGLSD